MEPRSEQLKNFLGGITSELRANYEIPKSARLWNFDVSLDRAIQHFGLKHILDEEHHIVEYEPNEISLTEEWFLQRHSALAIKADGTATLIDTTCTTPTSTIMLDSDVEMATLPIIYKNHIVWLDTNWDVWVKQISPSVQPGFIILTNLDPVTEANVRNTFFVEAVDGKLYIMSNNRVHRFEVADSNGNFNSGNDLAPYQPLTQFMQSPDRNGNQGTYTGLNGPELQILHQIDEAQSILNILGYYESSIDGVFGPATSAAVSAFQANYESTGNVPGGQVAGTPLVIDGIIGPETQAVMNAVDDWQTGNYRERKNVLVLPDRITAICNNGGYICIAVHQRDGNGVVYFWDKTLTANGVGDIGLATSVVVGNGVVQILKPLNSRLMAIMSPASNSTCVHNYDKLVIYYLQAGFDFLPEGSSQSLREYNLRVAVGDGSNFSPYRFNYLNQKSVIRGSRLYFSGQLHIQHIEDNIGDEGVYAGVMSIDSNGNLFFEVAKSDDANDFTYTPIKSFGLVDSGFILSTIDGVEITDETITDNVSGLITKIINGDEPWRNKQVDNIYLALNKTSGLTKVEVWMREMEDVDDAGAGWELVYTGPMQDSNSIKLNRMDDTQPFWKFREIQVMVKLFGVGAELLDLTVNYNMLAINK